MKKIFAFTVLATMIVSCLGDSGGSYSGTMEATFEYNKNKFGDDSVFFEGWPGWDYLCFCNEIDTLSAGNSKDTVVFKGGFACSYLRGADSLKTAENPVNPFRVCGTNESNTYLVWRETDDMPEHDAFFTASSAGDCVMIGCFVNNTEAVRSAIMSDGGFVAGNYLELKATGYLKDGTKTGEATIDLAEFAKKDSVVTAWTAFDLSSLASVDYIDFELVTDREDLPLDSFCMDYVVAKVSFKY